MAVTLSKEEPIPHTKNRLLCSECIQEMFLRGEVERSGHDGICSYCGQHGRTLSIDKIADFVDPVLSEFFYPTEPKPGESRSVADVINDSAEIGPEAAEDIRRVLAERNTVIEEGVTGSSDSRFDPDAHYVMRESVDASDLEVDWRDFERSLKHENRYFNRPGETLLAFLFEGIDRHETIRRDPIVVAAGPGTKHAILYRARQCEGDAELRKAMERPDKEVGPPPVPSARANRMNAAGISVFYGATDPAVALAEVRPPVGSKVLIGCFEVTRPLRLLDFVALSNLADQRGSRFDSDYVRRLKRAEFLRKLGERISEPVMPGSQILDYLPTQAMADFLATAVDPPLDGIIYRSAQDGHLDPDRRIFGGSGYKRNVILFQRSARVQQLDKGAKIAVSDDSLYSWASLFDDAPIFDDGPNLKYWVTVSSDAPSYEPDDAPLKLSTLEVHYVKGVKFDTSSSPVSRYYRAEEPEPK